MTSRSYKIETTDENPNFRVVTLITNEGHEMTYTVGRDIFSKELQYRVYRYIGGDWMHPVWKPLWFNPEIVAELEAML